MVSTPRMFWLGQARCNPLPEPPPGAERLPTDPTVTIDLPASRPGGIAFGCGMGMAHGTIEVEAK